MSTLLINTKDSTTRDSVDIAAPGVDGVSTIPLKDEDAQPLLKPATTVIVVNKFSWYSGPKVSSTALDKQPCAFLIEREQRLSSLISGALYYLNQSKKAFKQADNALQGNGTVKSLLGKIDSNIIMEKAKSMLNKFTGSTGTGISESDSALLANHNLNSIQGIYLTEETGFKYRLPMYNISQSVQNAWGDSNPNKSLLTGLVDAATEVVENFSTGYLNISQPGVYIEKPKYFTTGQTGESQTITFPLINTIKRGTQNPVQLNYELLWLLTFQNKSYKTSFSRTPPPKLYTISVPGQFSFPYAFISNMKVDFLGTIRRSTVTVPALNKSGKVVTTDIKVPVPDAYNVSITFESLIGDYGNAMMSPAFNTNISNGTVSFGS